ncbi:hypothetical protein AB0J81_13625 [Streptomyces bobili]|uniref:hypothetical protein n=1 Tax=Streptomyces bobili TaxID=67280 RepID=UPI00341AC431
MACDNSSTEPVKCQHPDKQYAGAYYDGPGGCKSYLYYTCPACKEHWREEERPASKSDFLRCRCTHFQLNHRPFIEGGCRNCACETFALKVQEPAKCTHNEHPFKPFQGYKDEPGKPHCLTCGHAEGVCDEHPAPIHKWKRCEQCRHPEHPSACTVCRCLAVTSVEDITNRCREAGGCPEHPKVCEHPNAHLTGASGSSEERIHRYSCPDCKATWEKTERRNVPVEGAADDAHDFVSPAHCAACMKSWLPPDSVPELECNCDPVREQDGYTYKSAYLHAAGCPLGQQPPEPPLTPEEEEQAPEDAHDDSHEDSHDELPPPEGPEYTPCVCGHIEPEHTVTAGQICMKDGCDCVAFRTEPDFDLPPQPDRRPPMLVAYSVQGHLYEAALSGDATVQAVDGGLVITHGLGPVAGIVQIMPVPSKEQG